MLAQKKINYLLQNCPRFNSHSWVAYLSMVRERAYQAEGKGHRQTLSCSHSRTESWRVDDHDGEVEGKWSVGLVTKIFICSALQDIGKLVFLYNCIRWKGKLRWTKGWPFADTWPQVQIPYEFFLLHSFATFTRLVSSCDDFNFLTISKTNIAPVKVSQSFPTDFELSVDNDISPPAVFRVQAFRRIKFNLINCSDETHHFWWSNWKWSGEIYQAIKCPRVRRDLIIINGFAPMWWPLSSHHNLRFLIRHTLRNETEKLITS